MKIKILIILISLLFISCKEVDKYNDPEDYCKFIVVQKQDNSSMNRKGDYYLIVKYNDIYKSLNVPEYYYNIYELGDTMCNKDLIKKRTKILNKIIDEEYEKYLRDSLSYEETKRLILEVNKLNK